MSESKFHPIKKGGYADVDISSVNFDVLSDYNPQVDYIKGEYILNFGSKRMEEWENDPRLLEYLMLLRANGMTKKKIAKDKMHIDYKTLLSWEKKSEKIQAALSGGLEELIESVEGAMFHRARGYEYEEVKTTVMGDVRKGSKIVENQQTVKVEKTTKHQPGDTGAQIFLLTNLSPEKWQNRQRVSSTIDGSVKTDVTIGEPVQIYLPGNGRDEVNEDGSPPKASCSEEISTRD